MAQYNMRLKYQSCHGRQWNEQRIEKIRQLVMLETIHYVKMKNMPDDSLTEGQEAVPYVKDIEMYCCEGHLSH